MKSIKLTLISLAALAFARPSGMCTANGVGDDLEAFKAEVAKDKAEAEAKLKQLEENHAALLEQNVALQKQLDEQNAVPEVQPDNSMLAMLCKGAGVEISDVRWRVQAGLDPEMAVAAAIAQKEHNEKPKEEQKEQK